MIHFNEGRRQKPQNISTLFCNSKNVPVGWGQREALCLVRGGGAAGFSSWSWFHLGREKALSINSKRQRLEAGQL